MGIAAVRSGVLTSGALPSDGMKTKSQTLNPKFLAEGESFRIENYNQAAPFSSFFPAIAGVSGKPMWVFYTNRGQGIASFGVNSKDGAMLEFLPANKAYQATPLLGFRTFIRRSPKEQWYEPFSVGDSEAEQVFTVRPYEIEIRDTNRRLGIETTVVYYGVPNESAPVLARQVSIRNLSSKPISFKIADGLPRVVPCGMGDFLVKNMSRTIEAFAEVADEHGMVPFFKLKVEPDDRPDVRPLDAGFFAFTVHRSTFQPIVVDPHVVFGEDSAFLRPSQLFGLNGDRFPDQLRSNIMPSAFFYANVSLRPKAEQTFHSFFGYADAYDRARAYAISVRDDEGYFTRKRQELKDVYADLVNHFGFRSADATLNAYANNTFMDNVLRGGLPITLSPKGPIVHVYSRKHGDMERDYNAFQISATYYSQGNGNFRDVNQNRRHDVLLNPRIGALNVEFFFNLLQLDGYNPLVINPVKFQVPKEVVSFPGYKNSEAFRADCQSIRKEPVLPGLLYEFVKTHALDPLGVPNLFSDLIQRSVPHQGIQHGEGFWVDHWTYNLDQLDRYLDVYPDRLAWLLYEKDDFTFHDSDHYVRPRKEKYVVTKDGRFRQYDALIVSRDKQVMIQERRSEPNKVRADNGAGPVFRTTLAVKLIGLVAVKASSLDPFGAGIEMDADKPGWCDALNGLPGLFGSSTHELFELRRLVRFMIDRGLPACPNKTLDLPHEVFNLQKDVSVILSQLPARDFRPVWDKLATAREHFREKTFFGISGKKRLVKVADLMTFLKRVDQALGEAEKQAIDPKSKLPTSYYTYEIEAAALPADWRSHLSKVPFRQHRVAPFLEGAVHLMKNWPKAKNKKLYETMKKSVLADKKLKMYRLNAPLAEESSEIGRIRIFSGGWLENESIFLHMHYKYLLEILKSGLVDEFFAEMKNGVIAYRDMETYGRPIFENSSFLASSAFPKKDVHGRGFVARLSGATAEFLSMIYLLAFGPSMFRLVDGQLRFSPRPQLPGDWFAKRDEEGLPKNGLKISLFDVPVVFMNPKRRSTFGTGAVSVVGFEWIYDGRFYRHDGADLPADASAALREGRVESLTIFLDRA